MTRIAFVGLGRMGAPMAGRLSAAGHQLTVWSRTSAHAQAFNGRAVVAESAAAAANDAEVAVTMVSDPAVLETVVFGRDGLAERLRPGSVLLDMSTVGPAAAQRTAKALASREIGFVDAPVVGSHTAAAAGTLGVLVGGDVDQVDRVRPLLGVMGDPEQLRHLGPVGSGQAAKLMVNLVLGNVMAAVAEGLALGRVLGLDKGDALDILEDLSAGADLIGRKRGRVEPDDYRDVSFALALMHKDLRLAVDAAEGARASLPATERVATLFAGAKGKGLADQDYSAVAAYVASMAHTLNDPVAPRPNPA